MRKPLREPEEQCLRDLSPYELSSIKGGDVQHEGVKAIHILAPTTTVGGFWLMFRGIKQVWDVSEGKAAAYHRKTDLFIRPNRNCCTSGPNELPAQSSPTAQSPPTIESSPINNSTESSSSLVYEYTKRSCTIGEAWRNQSKHEKGAILLGAILFIMGLITCVKQFREPKEELIAPSMVPV